MNELVLAGAAAGMLLGVVLRRADLCFHSMFRGLFEGQRRLIATWALGVAVAAVGLSLIYEWSDWGLNEGLPFDPVSNIVGGLLIGAGMVVALSCASGLFYKLGAGMVGALVGLLGWVLGERVVRDTDLPGERVLDPGEDATLPGVLGVSRLLVAVVILVAVVVFLLRRSPGSSRGAWRWPAAGLALGLVTTAAWALAGWSGASFGPSTVGASTATLDRLSGDQFADQAQWQVSFLVGIVAGSAIWSVTSGKLWVRGEDLRRYGGLAVGGFLLGAGGRVAGGCNLGHGLSGMAQMNISSYVTVASMAAGVWLTAMAARLLRGTFARRSRARTDWRADATV